MIRVKQNLKKDRIAEDAKMYSCTLCGAKHSRVEFWYNSGSDEHTEDETLTGATSGATGSVVGHTLHKGKFSSGDAEGTVELDACTGISDRESFESGEVISGNVGGRDMMTTASVGSEKVYGRLYPEWAIAVHQGKKYCLPHYEYVTRNRDERDAEIDITEEDRGVDDFT